MPSKIEGLGILLLLLPGFVCALFVQAIALRPRQSELEKVIEALLFSSVLYLAIGPFFQNTLPIEWQSSKDLNGEAFHFVFNGLYLLSLLGGAGLLALIYGVTLNRDLLHTVLRRWKVTERTSRTSVWNDTLQDIRSSYLLVELGDRRTVVGYLRYYSDNVEQGSLFLEDAAWVDREGRETPIEGPGILLTKEAGILSISFLEPVVS